MAGLPRAPNQHDADGALRERVREAVRFARCVTVESSNSPGNRSQTLLWTPVPFELSEFVIGARCTAAGSLPWWRLYFAERRSQLGAGGETLVCEGGVTPLLDVHRVRSFQQPRIPAESFLWVEWNGSTYTNTYTIIWTVVPKGVV